MKVRPLNSGVVLSLLMAQSAIAQDLQLFEEPETAPNEQNVPLTPQQNFPGGGQPAYTLRSISRFGDQYQAVFIDRAGQTVKAVWNAGETAPIPNSGFSVVAAGPASVSLMHPPGDNCVGADAVGVSCSAGNRSELRLSLAAPLASNGAPQGPLQPFFENGAVPMGPAQGFVNDGAAGAYPPGFDPAQANGQQVFINPFSGEPEVMPEVSPEELAARQQRQELRAARLRQFDQQRIDDAAIPPGMERVRTPFGDRLMPIRE